MPDGGSLVINSGQMKALDKCFGNAVAPCPKPTVAIELSAPVACPGHPLPLEAKGSPEGGTYSWTVAGPGAELVDGSGRPATDGSNVYLRSFQPDQATGRIPPTKAMVSVTYTHPNGTASDSKDVPVHGIDFTVTPRQSTYERLEAKEDPGKVSIESQHENSPTMNVDMTVKIHLAPSCPRKKECAANHRVGWLQDIVAWDKGYQFRHRRVQWKLVEGPPIRDSVAGSDFPFYAESFDFTDDLDYYSVNHSDSPAFGAMWEDSKDERPEQSPLEKVVFKLGFAAWLAVQNREAINRGVPGSLLYLANFGWSIDCVLNRTSPPSSRKTTPQFFTPNIGAITGGQGGRTPSFTASDANDGAKPESTPIKR